VAYSGIFFGGGVQQIQLRTEGKGNGDLGAVAPSQVFRSICNPVRLCQTFGMSGLLRMYFPRNWEFGSALSKLWNFGVVWTPQTPAAPSVRHCYQPSTLPALVTFQDSASSRVQVNTRALCWGGYVVNSYLCNYRHRLLHVIGCTWIRFVLSGCVWVCEWWSEK
jgi:hypothetical protein